MPASVRVTYKILADATALATEAATGAMQDVVDACLEEANRTVPLEDGPLMGSGFTQVMGGGGGGGSLSRFGNSGEGVTGMVGYGTPYACVQHEDASLTHDAGRTDHWLEKTVDANGSTYLEHIAAEVKRRLS
jgi:hypothetical protein